MGDDPGARARVYSKIAPVIMDFAAAYAGRLFYADDLRRYVVSKRLEVAPDSPGRILRVLRQEGRLDYVVVDRSLSLYQFRSRGQSGSGGIPDDADYPF